MCSAPQCRSPLNQPWAPGVVRWLQRSKRAAELRSPMPCVWVLFNSDERELFMGHWRLCTADQPEKANIWSGCSCHATIARSKCAKVHHLCYPMRRHIETREIFSPLALISIHVFAREKAKLRVLMKYPMWPTTITRVNTDTCGK